MLNEKYTKLLLRQILEMSKDTIEQQTEDYIGEGNLEPEEIDLIRDAMQYVASAFETQD